MKILTLVIYITLISGSTFAQNTPTIVRESFNKKFPDAVSISWVKENAHEYEASFMINEVKHSANFSDKGEWLETETVTSFDKLPLKVQEEFNTNYKKYKVKSAAVIETSGGLIKYEVEYKVGKKTLEVFYDSEGKATN